MLCKLIQDCDKSFETLVVQQYLELTILLIPITAMVTLV